MRNNNNNENNNNNNYNQNWIRFLSKCISRNVLHVAILISD